MSTDRPWQPGLAGIALVTAGLVALRALLAVLRPGTTFHLAPAGAATAVLLHRRAPGTRNGTTTQGA